MGREDLTPIMVALGDLQHAIICEEIYIPVRDGTRLAARIWRPEAAGRYPVILEYIPYRKRDTTRTRDEESHGYLAGHGYVSVRVDMRGSGDSEGIQMDEYLPVEQQDGVDVIDWLSSQSWSSGAVGMFGISWGGITALQIAAHRPPALKAIVPVGATDDRYYDDGCYFLGGYAGETVGWGGVMFGYSSRPPDPQIYGEGWRDAWMKRMQDPPLFMKIWLEHQQRDDYWLQGSVCTDYSRIEVPVYAVCGWTDCWPNTVLRLMRNLPNCRKGLIGPWGHLYPTRPLPGPGVNFLDEMLRWFDRWLKGIENGIENEPLLTLYRQQNVPADARHDWRDGDWLDAKGWPDSSARTNVLWLDAGNLSERPGACHEVSVSSPQSLGYHSGDYMPGAEPRAQMPGDQRPEDAGSVCFDTAPLKEPMDIIGTSKVSFDVRTNAGNGLLAVRLCDVSPDGASTLITYGIMNLAQRNGREIQAPVTPGERYKVSLSLNDVAHRLLPGHRLRVAVSNAMWPMAWPVAENHVLTLYTEACSVHLPSADLMPSDQTRVLFQRPRLAVPEPSTTLVPSVPERRISVDHGSGARILSIKDSVGRHHLPGADLTFSYAKESHFEIRDDDVLSAKAEYSFEMAHGRDGWDVATRGQMTVTCDETSFFLKGDLRAYENGQEVYHRNWDEVIQRRGF